MTVSANNPRLSYNGDAVSVAFTSPYFLASADLKVYVGGVLKTLTTDYSVSGVGTPSGGTVTFVSAPPAGTGNVVILRDPDLLQATAYPSNDSFPASAHETALDKLTMIVQRLKDLLGRSFTLSDSDTSGASLTVPTPAALKFLRWNSGATGLEAVDMVTLGSIALPLAVNQGGTGSTTAATARAALGAGTGNGDALQASIQTQSYTKFTAGGTADAITGALSPVIVAYASGMRITTTPPGANTLTAPTINLSTLGAKKVFKRGDSGAAVALAVGDYNASGPFDFEYNTALDSAAGGWVLLNPIPVSASSFPPVRQTVLSGPVDSNGLASFGGSTGSTTVTASGTLKATCAAGGSENRTGSIVNPSWTGLVTSATVTTPVASPGVVNWTGHPLQVGEPVVFSGGTLPTGITAGTTYYVIAAGLTANAFEIATAPGGSAINFTGSSSGTQTCCAQTTYLYLDIASDGTTTTGSTPHAPVYQWGGSYSTVNNAHTFNIQEMTMKAGNGSTSSQVYRVFVGEVAILTALVNSITWYALMGRYQAPTGSAFPAVTTRLSFNHNLGVEPGIVHHFIRCKTAELNYSIGDRLLVSDVTSGGSTVMVAGQAGRLDVGFITTSATPFTVNKTTGAVAGITRANWEYMPVVQRGW